MTEYRELKKKIEQRVAVLADTIQELESHEIVDERACTRWKDQLVQVSSSLEDPLLRIAVVGTVKSGKSTLINALAGKDLLKRGAGIITAFVTRLVTHGEIAGWVELKPWEQILDELNASLRMVPHYSELLDEDHLVDIRLAEDRDRIESLLVRMWDEWRQKDGHLDPSHLLLRGFLDGYDRVQQFIGDEAKRVHFNGHSLDQHQRYVGSEGQAVYLRDMELHYPISWLGDSIELADCQGIDSPNPLHFALLQQYLLKTHLILYVISSRSGLREADFRLLDFIRTLKMLPRTFFVLNADLDDHPHLLDLESLASRVRNELSWLVRDPRFFTFSALYHLVEQMGESASERERRHLQLWLEELSLIHFTESGFSSFRESLSQTVCGQRLRVLCGSGLNHLSIVAGSVMNTAAAQRKLLDHNMEDVRQKADGLKDKQERLLGSIETLKNAISGLRTSLCNEVDRMVDPFFELAQGRIISETLNVVENYPIQFDHDKDLTDYRWLFHQFHRLYREFRQLLTRFLVEKVNLQLIEFAKKEEASLCERLRRAAEAFWTLFSAALEEYRRETGLFDAEGFTGNDLRGADWQVRGTVAPPNFSVFVDQGAIGRGILLMKLGLAGFTRFLGDFRSRLGKGKDLLLGAKKHESMRQEAVKLLKKEAANELIQAFVEYRSQFKSNYLYRIVDDETGRLMQEFDLRAEMAQVKLGDLLQRRQTEGVERESLVEMLMQTHQISQAMVEELEELRGTLN